MKHALSFVAIASLLVTGVASAQSAATVGIEDLRENPKKYDGQIVTVSGEVERILGPRLFGLSQETLFDLFDDDVFVHVPTAVAVAVSEDQDLTVTGRFQTFTGIDIEDELGWFEPEPDIEAEFNQRYVILATTIVSSDVDDVAVAWNIDRSGTPVPVDQPGQPDRPVGTTGTAGMVTTIEPLADADADDMVGRIVNLQAPVASVTGDRVFTIGSGQERMLVLVAEPLGAKGEWEENVNPGSTVMVKGLVLAVPEDLPLPKLSEEEQQILSGQEVYIYATRIDPVKGSAKK